MGEGGGVLLNFFHFVSVLVDWYNKLDKIKKKHPFKPSLQHGMTNTIQMH